MRKNFFAKAKLLLPTHYLFIVDCTEAADCVDIGRDECSLETPEQTCGECLSGYVGQTGDGNSECISECGSRTPRSYVVNGPTQACSLASHTHNLLPVELGTV